MAAVAGGADIRTVGRLAFPSGSFANGGAMRIAPIGVAFRNAGDQELRVAVENAIVSSHRHPEAIDGAVVMAKAVAFLMQHTAAAAAACGGGGGGGGGGGASSGAGDTGVATTLDLGNALLETLLNVATNPNMKRKLSMLRRHHGKASSWATIVWTLADDDETGRDVPG